MQQYSIYFRTYDSADRLTVSFTDEPEHKKYVLAMTQPGVLIISTADLPGIVASCNIYGGGIDKVIAMDAKVDTELRITVVGL